jgi:hypothetical protein
VSTVPLRNPSYHLAQHAAHTAAKASPTTAAFLRGLLDQDDADQTTGWLDGLAERRPDRAAPEPHWLAVTIAAAYPGLRITRELAGLGRAA